MSAPAYSITAPPRGMKMHRVSVQVCTACYLRAIVGGATLAEARERTQHGAHLWRVRR